MMTIEQIITALDARVLRGHDKLDQNIYCACCSDLMSDVLAFVNNEKTALLTGLTNIQVVRTAEMLDLKCLIFARGKVPDEQVLDAADELGLVVLTAPRTMFTCAGILFEGGVRGASLPWPGLES
ncbi:MAG: DRTGG domain-containing protein [Christensenellales bacterium]